MNRNRSVALWRLLALLTVVLVMGLATMPCRAQASAASPTVVETSAAAGDFRLVKSRSVAPIYRDAGDYAVVQIATESLAADMERVTGVKPHVLTGAPQRTDSAVLVGTLGKSALIDRLVATQKLDVQQIRGRWESFVIATVADPLPGVRSGLVIAGSDRRGTSYGVFALARAIGVSPWYWWSDVPAPHHDSLFVRAGVYRQGSPGVKYRGIFLNDEDWGLNPWASKTFDPAFGNIGPKTYAKIFELMLRLRLNYLWPAMHACSKEFGATPENAALADRYGIVVGASHCEPMLYNNVHWKQTTQGPWNYSTNRDAIHATWESSAKARGADEAVWTLGIRGIHDAPMQMPPQDMPGKLSLMTGIFHDQRVLLNQYVSREWGAVAQCFVPYKEVLPIYDAGLKVPDDVTLVWVDDNFGYIRRLSGPEERKRSGGSGVYWHLSYYGLPHSYTWINTTAPALIWEELHKAWENDAGRLWVLNVGDLKPMEIGIDYYARLAWNPNGFDPDAQQPEFLRSFAAENFGAERAQAIANFLADYYRLGTIRKPELMNRGWAMNLTRETASKLEGEYTHLLRAVEELRAALPSDRQDAFTELIGFPARVLGDAGMIFLADRKAQRGDDAAGNEGRIAALRTDLETQVTDFNTRVAGGKWNRMMSGLVTGKDLTKWNSQVRWPWGEKALLAAAPTPSSPEPGDAAVTRQWRDAATTERRTAVGPVQWTTVPGLGPSGRAVALMAAGMKIGWSEMDPNAPQLQWDFTIASGANALEAWIDFLPTFRLYPGRKLRVAVSVDEQAPVVVEVPGSSGAEDERGSVRRNGVENNYVRARVPLPLLPVGKHTFQIRAVDPGVVIDRVSLP